MAGKQLKFGTDARERTLAGAAILAAAVKATLARGNGCYELSDETRMGPLFEGCEVRGAEDSCPELYIKRIRLL